MSFDVETVSGSNAEKQRHLLNTAMLGFSLLHAQTSQHLHPAGA